MPPCLPRQMSAKLKTNCKQFLPFSLWKRGFFRRKVRKHRVPAVENPVGNVDNSLYRRLQNGENLPFTASLWERFWLKNGKSFCLFCQYTQKT